MSGFKLIAITPLKNCDPKFRKNLKIGTPYRFYNNYDVQIDKDSKRVIKVIPETSALPENFFTLKNGIQLNISAVVGKNGSGKSTLFELFYYLIFELVTTKKNLPTRIKKYSETLTDNSNILKRDYLDIEKVIGPIDRKGSYNLKLNPEELNALGFKTAAAYIHSLLTKHHLNTNISGSTNDVNSLLKIWSDIGYKIEQNGRFIIKEEIESERRISEGLQLSVLYEIDDSIYEIEYLNQKFEIYEIDKINHGMIYKCDVDVFDLSNFFYTISLNYSLHALNSETIGGWINQLFHKNDAYTTPVVINPMREDGDIDVNSESELTTDRLMTNIIFNLHKNSSFKLFDKYKTINFIFEPKRLSPYPLPIGFKLEPTSTLYTLIIEEVGITSIQANIPYWEFAFSYLERKLQRINTNYPFLIQLHANNKDPLVSFIKSDNTHITKKVKQTLNFLKATKSGDSQKFWQHPEGNVKIEIPVEKYVEWINTFEKSIEGLTPDELSEFALPGFMTVDFELECDDGSKITLSSLSSGERQMIFNTNAILYHLYNLQSVHRNINKQKEGYNNNISRVKYENINIVLDEVELYYHPEMQRRLVNDLKENIENIKEKETGGIRNINVCFLTHSPFILSDIPSENVLRLDSAGDGKSNILEETFAANINDLLASGFFMDTLIGKFAENKITKVIENLSQNNLKEDDEQVIDIIGDSFLKASITQYKENSDD